ncbi:MAG: ComF family protein [Deltaproteobacteria bacterium]|nr:ComF family protein [Deltaproteobacteria bacterium]
MDAIHNFKYAGKRDLGKSLGSLLSSYALKHLKDVSSALIMPVPLHPGRIRERGFNQSLILAREVSKGLGYELDFLSLRRIKYTSPQTGLKRLERRKNVRNVFEYRGGTDIRGRDVLLVDDVATTGSTLDECAKQLKKHGCKDVFCLVLARTSP